MTDDLDADLCPARGAIIAVILSLLIWAAIVAIFWRFG